MGWASYREDIVSRFNAANMSRARKSRKGPIQKAIDVKASGPLKKFMSSQKAIDEKASGPLKKFVSSSARPLPVIVLADVSGSMREDGKIDALNVALKDMITAFAEEDVGRVEIQVAMITFGDTANVHF